MEIKKRDLLTLLKPFSTIIKQDMIPPVLSSIKLWAEDGYLCAFGTDRVLKVQNKVKAEGDLVANVPFILLYRLTKAHRVDITLTTTKRHLTVTSKSGTNKLGLTGYPEVPFPFETDHTIETETLKSVLRELSLSIDPKNPRVELRGFGIGDEIVGSNAKQITTGKLDLVDGILPTNGIKLVLGFTEPETKVGGQYCFSNGDLQLYSPPLVATYPDYKKALPNEPKLQVTVDGLELKTALENLILYNEEKGNLEFVEGGIKLTGRGTKGQGELFVGAEVVGSGLSIRINPKNLIKYLKPGNCFLEVVGGRYNFLVIARNGIIHYLPERLN